MSVDSQAVLAGAHFLDGDEACAEGAIAAGCRFFAGYPITPSTEIAERIAGRFPDMGGVFIQMEDELASMAAVIGAVWGGAKAMTVTSGPGFSLMMENIGLAAMMETPCVVTNVQRGGPSTGLPTQVGQADMMQARWGSHGDYSLIALSPDSPQECFELTVEAFNLSETYRVPVMMMMDECVGHMTERVVIPETKEISVVPRRLTEQSPEDYLPYAPRSNLVPEMCRAGDGYRIHTTGLTHDERGYPDMTEKAQDRLVRRLLKKIEANADDIFRLEESWVDDADLIVISYGITSRVAGDAVERARKKELRVGSLRLQTIWPFPEKRIKELASRVSAFVVPEINMGQMVREVERSAAGQARVVSLPLAGGGVHRPEDIVDSLLEARS